MFKADLTQFEQACKDVHALHQDVNVSKERTAAVNVQFMTIMRGAWAQAENAACVLLESNLRVFNEALSNLASDYDSAYDALSGKVSTARDAVMNELGGSTSDRTKLQLNDGAVVPNAVTAVDGSYDSLKTAIADATSALSGLENSGDIAAALSDLESKASDQKSRIGRVGTAYSDFATSVSDFESTYSGRFDPAKFITDKMVDTASKGMESTYAHTPLGQVSGFLSSIKGSAAFKNFKKWGSMAGDALSTLKKGVDNAKYMSKALGGVRDAFVGALQNYDCTGDVVYALKHGSRDMLSALGKGTIDSVKHWWKTLSNDPSKIGTLDEKNAWAGFISKWQDKTGLFRADKIDDVVKNGSVGSLLDSAKDIKDASSKVGAVSEFGTHVKKFFRGVGFVGDAIEVTSYVSDTAEAYYTHEGDGYEKVTAGAVQAVEGVAKFGIGKAIGAGVGFVFGGGPVGAVAGMFVGGLIDEGVKGLFGAFDKSDAKEGIIDGVSGFFRGIFGGGKKSAFAAS